jgi:cytochrome c553
MNKTTYGRPAYNRDARNHTMFGMFIVISIAIFGLFATPKANASMYATLGCIGCHGANGVGASAPALNDKTPEYIVAQLKAFQNGSRVNPTMNAMSQMAKGHEEAIANEIGRK